MACWPILHAVSVAPPRWNLTRGRDIRSCVFFAKRSPINNSGEALAWLYSRDPGIQSAIRACVPEKQAGASERARNPSLEMRFLLFNIDGGCGRETGPGWFQRYRCSCAFLFSVFILRGTVGTESRSGALRYFCPEFRRNITVGPIEKD